MKQFYTPSLSKFEMFNNTKLQAKKKLEKLEFIFTI